MSVIAMTIGMPSFPASASAAAPAAAAPAPTSPGAAAKPAPARQAVITDEPGTDHTTGLKLAQTMLTEQNGPTVYNATVMLTDGIPNGILAGNGTIRHTPATAFTEPRWREYMGPAPHTTTQIQTDAVALSNTMWTGSLRTNQWVVSFVQDGAFMHNMVHGNGTYTLTSNSAALVGIFQQVARSLPLVIVR